MAPSINIGITLSGNVTIQAPAAPVETFEIVGSTRSTTATAAVPTEGTDGRLLVAFVARGLSGVGTTWPVPAGWTKIHEIADNTNRANIGAFWKVASGSEPAGYEFLSGDPDNNKYATTMYAISGADNVSPIIGDATREGNDGNETAHVLGAVTSVGDGALRLAAAFAGWGGDFSYTPPAGMTEDYDFRTIASGGGGGVLGVARQADVVAGTYTGQFTMSVALFYATSHLLIKPAS